MIAVTGSERGGRWMWWFNRLSLWLAGAKALRMTPKREIDFGAIDALLVGGGEDIDASLYGGELTPVIRIDRARDEMELAAIRRAEEIRLPVLGVCRGAQMLNVACGGSLHADIHEAYEGVPRMRTPLPRKRVWLREGTRLREIMGCESCMVNAIHHQSVERVGDTLTIAVEDRYGIVQGIESQDDGRFVFGVQWHPEFLFLHGAQRRLYRALVTAAREHAGDRG